MHLYIPNMGGVGLALPQTTLSWSMMALLSLVIGLGILFNKQRIIITPTMKLLFLALALLAVPLLFTRPEWLEAALWRWAGLLGGLIFYFSWLQTDISNRTYHGVFYAILLAVVIQAFMALLQLFGLGGWIPYPLIGGRPYGVFQQVNLLASFTATGLALALTLFLLPVFNLQSRQHEKFRLMLLALLLAVFPALLVWLQSRIGWLGGAAVALLFIAVYARKYPQRSGAAVLMMLLGTVIGIAVLAWCNQVGAVSHVGSDSARSVMLNTTLAMIVEKPLSGWGYGGFEYSFQHFRAALGQSTLGVGVAAHPHNELLLWWVEGGLPALLGMLLLLFAGLRLAYKAWCNRFSADQGIALALCFVLLPMALHTQTEYPFYLSTLHWAIFLLLLAMLDRLVTPASECGALTGIGRKIPAILLPIASLITLLVMLAGLLGGMALTRAEQNNFTDMREVAAMSPVASLLQGERRQFDQQVYALLLFNQTQDEALLSGYAQWATGYLKKHIDRNVYASLYLILKHQGNNTQAERLQREALAFFPDDPRFM
ncbi:MULTISPECIES: PglL family O-oligosaccharyltransferase [unclassified Serratia (in: enterobacteria)]|uniref:PglL family O-oligosaccharyltransferase n=1 Tax=unclassified Serratia (in: enterobacteria) TaxID=2647522 RepID=UPI002ED5DE83|nr:Wzy polymerase domain-containing protein [Serratia sp. C2(2)]MEE4449681.1 Wzy polymerase domain-containing protein [Serratia sp. C2(1)]